MATHSSVLAWRIPGTGEPGGLLSMGSHRVGHDWSDLAAVAAASNIYKQLIQLNGKKTNNPIKKRVEELNRHFSKQEMQMADRHLKRWSTWLTIREMQIKTTVRCHLTCVRTAVIRKNTNKKCWQACEEKGTTVHCLWEHKVLQSLWKTVWRLLKKFKRELPQYPAIPLLGIYVKKTKTLIQKYTCTPIFARVFINYTAYNLYCV